MLITLYMVTTANGFIADLDGGVDWVSTQAWENYRSIVTDIGAVLIGRNTYDVMPAEEFFPGVQYVVLTNRPIDNKANPVTCIAGSPAEVVELLEQAGVEAVCIAGGAATARQFMDAGLIDEMILDVEAARLPEGINLFEGEQRHQQYKMINEIPYGDSLIQLRYKKT